MPTRVTTALLRSSAVLAWIFASTPAAALGLGDIRIESSLGSQLRATIALGGMGASTPAEILVGSAGESVYRDYGIDKAAYTGNLRYALDIDDKGNASVRVSSTQPITEPVIDMVVELKWPSGRAVKHYTVLLDPPAR